MWLKVTLLLAYITLLFILSRVLDALSWSENGFSGMLSRQLLDPMALSVAKLKALLEQRGVSYEGVVEKSELSDLVRSTGPVSSDEVNTAQLEGDKSTETSETNFTCGAHFIEQVEDAKDSVWLVQVVRHSGQLNIVGDVRWKAIKKKVTKFGVRTGLLDCSLDYRYCAQKGWHSPFLLLALPSEFEKKASIAMHNYSGPVHETVVLRWVRDKLAERVMRIRNPDIFKKSWQNFTSGPLDPEIRVVLFTESKSPPLFYSALTVKFPGRVKFGMVSQKFQETNPEIWHGLLTDLSLPSFVIYSIERNYTYGNKRGEQFSFASMEQHLKFLYPCLNDIFILSFCLANVMSLFEFFVSNCSITRRILKCIWCIIKYNIVVIMLWLPLMGLFQMPFLDQIPLVALKLERIFCTSHLGAMLKGDFSFFQNHPFYIYFSFVLYLISVFYLCKKYREEEDETENWFNFSHSASLVHLRPNNLLEPMGLTGSDFLGRLDMLGARLTPQSLWLQPSISSEYIQHLRTWPYCPPSVAEKAAENVKKVEMAMRSFEEATHLDKTSLTHSGVHSDLRTVEGKTETFTEHDRQFDRFQSEHNAVSNASNESDQPLVARSASPVSKLSCAMCSKHTNQESSFLSTVQCTCRQNPQALLSTHQTGIGAMVSSESTSDIQSSASAVDSSSLSSLPSSNSEILQMMDIPESPCDKFPTSSTSCPPYENTQGFPFGYIESHQCVICLEEYVPKVMLCGLPCGHVFHETCIITWLNREKHFCPMCRWPSYQSPSSMS